MQKLSRHRLLIGSAIAFSLLITLLIALPLVSAHYLEQWLQQQGAANASVEDINFNPFTGKAEISGLSADGGDGSRLQVDLAAVNLRWWPLASQRIYIESIALQGARADIVFDENGSVRVGGLLFAAADKTAEVAEADDGPQFQWGFGSESLELSNIHLTYQDASVETRLDINRLTVGSQFTWQKNQSAGLAMDIAINGAPLRLGGEATPWANSPDFGGNINLSGLQLGGFGRLLEKASPLQNLRGELGLNLDVAGRYTDDGRLALTINGPMTLTDGGLVLNSLDIAQQHISWDGTMALNLPPANGEPMAKVAGKLDLDGLVANESAQQLQAVLDQFQWQGEIEFSPASKEASLPLLSGEMALSASGLRIDHTQARLRLAAFNSLAVKGASLSGINTMQLANLELDQLQLLGSMDDSTAATENRNNQTLTIRQLIGNELRIADQQIHLAELEVHDPTIFLVRNSAGELERIATLQQLRSGATEEESGAAAPPESNTRATGTGVTFTLDKLTVNGDQWLSFQDHSIDPPATFALNQIDMQVDGVSTDAGKPMTIALETGAGVMQLKITGAVALPAPDLFAELEIELKSLDLPPLSPYVPGYDLFRGRFSTESRVTIRDNTLTAENDLLIEKLKITAKQTDSGGGGSSLPVNIALDMLRNNKDEIRLEVPIKGELDDPSFGTGDVIRTASSKALQGAALSYATAALQPFGAIMMVGKVAAKATRPGLQPVAMPPGEATLPAAGLQYLEKIGTLLTDRPGLSLTLCGVVSEADRQAMALTATPATAGSSNTSSSDPGNQPSSTVPATVVISDAELLTLAAARTRVATDYLINQQGITADRLFSCREQIDDSAEAAPRVDITL